MVGGGPFRLNPGEWTDDTSMALCLAASLVELGRFDPHDQMRRYCKWMREGYLSSNGRCFDIGNTVRNALFRFQQNGEPFSGSVHPASAGNGCIMRLAPVPMFFYPDRKTVIEMSGESSRTTHGAETCVEASQLLGGILFQALSGAKKEDILSGHGVIDIISDEVESIAQGAYFSKSVQEIEGSGYVVRCLEAALWCFWQTTSFEDAILRVVNLGGDTDTTAAACGQVAGAYYGESGIPKKWLERLVMCDEIRKIADGLMSKNIQQ
jgi:ADP-ribosyl-[dinitrogen reductase] hydrolase